MKFLKTIGLTATLLLLPYIVSAQQTGQGTFGGTGQGTTGAGGGGVAGSAITPNLNHITIGTTANPCPTALTTCYQAAFDVLWDGAATFTATNTTIVTSGTAPPFCNASTVACPAGRTSDVGKIAIGTYDCLSVNPGQCLTALAHTTIVSVTDAHHAVVAVAPTHTTVGGTGTNFAWGTNDQTALVAAFNALIAYTNVGPSVMDLPCGAAFFNADLFVSNTSPNSSTSIHGCGGQGTTLIPLPNFTCTNSTGCFLFIDSGGFGQQLGKIGQAGSFKDLNFWGLGYDVTPGDSSFTAPGKAGVVCGPWQECDNVWVQGWVWNVVNTFPIYGFRCIHGCTLKNSGSYVGGNFSAHITGDTYYNTTIINGEYGGSANDGITIDGTGSVTSMGALAYEGVISATANGVVVNGANVTYTDIGSTLSGVSGLAGTINLNGSHVIRNGATHPDITNAGATIHTKNVQFTSGGVNFLNQSSGTFYDDCGNSGETAITLSGGTAIENCSVATDTQLAKAAAQTAKTVFTVGPATALFRVHLSVECTTTSAAATVTPSILYTDTAGTVQTVTGTAATCTSANAAADTSQDVTFRAKTATAIQYQTVIASTPTYDVSINVEQLGLI